MMKNKGCFCMVLRFPVKKQPTNIAMLPDEIIFDILLLIPAHILHGVMRIVCRQWNRIINDPVFVATLLRPTTLFLVQDPKFVGHFLHVRECDIINLSSFRFQFPGDVLATCNGLTLVRDRRYETTHRLCYIVNPATNRMMTLPTMPLNEYRCCLAFAASSNTYKVVVVTKDKSCIYRFRYQCAILTVNVDRAWRLVNCADIDEFLSIFMCRPVMSTGFVYWASVRFSCMVALNIESESIGTISLPQMDVSNSVQIYFRPKGNTISYIYIYKDYSIKVWVLKDHESEDWVKFPDLGVEEMRRQLTTLLSLRHLDNCTYGNYLNPISWLKNEERILFEMILVPNSLLVYDVKTGATFTCNMDIDDGIMLDHLRLPNGLCPPIFPHLSSLTWVSGY